MTLETVPCPSCGATAAPDDAFCAECGGNLRSESAASPVPPLRAAPETGTDGADLTRMAQSRTENASATAPMSASAAESPSAPTTAPTSESPPTPTTTSASATTLGPAPTPPTPASAPPAPAAGRPTSVDLTKLDTTARVAAVCGLLAFINSFLPWYTVSFDGVGVGSANAWDLDYAWLPVLLMLGLAIVVVLPAFGVEMRQMVSPAWIGVVGIACAIIVVIRWATYPTANDLGVDAGAGVGTYLGLALALVVAVVGIRADTTHDRSLSHFFGSMRHAGDHQPPARP